MITDEQRNNIHKGIERAIADIARKNNVLNENVKAILIDKYVDEDDFTIIQWPEVQAFFDIDGFYNNACLANDEWTLNKYGSSAYFVNKQWLNSI